MSIIKKTRKQLHIELRETQKALDIAIKEIVNLRKKREYWELKYKKEIEKK